MLLIYSWFYTSWTLPEDEEIPEIFLNISGIIWIVLFILSQDWLWLHHILEEVTFSKSSWASTTYDVYNYLFHQQVFLSQHETNIHRILWLNRRWFYCVIPLHTMLKVYDRVATEREVHIFQGRDGGYNFSAEVKDMTLSRSNHVTDGIYVRCQWRIFFYCMSVVSCCYRSRLSWWRCFKDDDDGWVVVESNTNLGMFLR